jgi:mannose-6-phosphate isomerase-like protein (cupin superfamily)
VYQSQDLGADGYSRASQALRLCKKDGRSIDHDRPAAPSAGGRFPMQTRSFPSTPDGRSPAGAEIRYLIEGETGGMIHSTVPPGQVNRATVHATVSEFWHVLSGEGEIWRRDGTGEETTVLARGVSIDIPVGTAFQYRCIGVDALRFLCITMPPWPGDQEATVVEGPWKPTAAED